MVIELTNTASEELKRILDNKKTDKLLRIYIAGYGWGGPSFGLALDEQKDGDTKTVAGDYTFLVEEGLADSFGKFTVDYSNNWLRKGFSIIPDRGGSSC